MLYIHIPYCKGKCIYCDFYSAGNPQWDKYLKAVVSELSERKAELGDDFLTSLYIGGGTPSLIPAETFRDFIHEIKTVALDQIPLEASPEGFEFTIEVNPEDVDEERAGAWKESGVNRISMGVQTMDDGELTLLGRRHNAEKVEKSIEILKRYFNNISLDIIYGIPGQTTEILGFTLGKIVSFEPTHVSAYSLTYEEKTLLSIYREKGKIREATEEEYLLFDRIVAEKLAEAGYERYEISNYSLPGYRSRHNSGYWSGKPYLGLGPSASSYDGKRRRRTNLSDIKSYIEGRVRFDSEILTDEELMEEQIMTRLRTKEGLHIEEMTEAVRNEIMKKAERWINEGEIRMEDGWLKLTETGIPISDYIILSLV